MGIIRDAIMKFNGKRVRVKLFGYEKDGKFILNEAYISQTDLENIDIIDKTPSWDDVIKQEGVKE